MTTSYTQEWVDALADVREAGAAIAFVETIAGTLNASTNRTAASTTNTVSGYAIGRAGDSKRYAELGLSPADSRTLFFVPSTMGDIPALNAVCTWGGVQYKVRNTRPLDIDGTPIACNVVLGR